MANLMHFTAREVEDEYRRLSLKSGWSLFYCPEARMSTADFAVVGLNPGGRDNAGPYAETWECPNNAYISERWGPNDTLAPLQIQVRAWHELVGVHADETLCVQYVPFRSRDWQGLAHQDDVLAFSQRLWSWIANEARAHTFLAMGKVTGDGVADAIGCGPEEVCLPTGWGKQKIRVRKSKSGRRVITMPHPSRYRLFGRHGDRSQQAEDSFRVALAH